MAVLDFRLIVRRKEQGFEIRVASEESTIRCSPVFVRLENLEQRPKKSILTIQEWILAAYQLWIIEPDEISFEAKSKAVGQYLFSSVFQGDVLRVFQVAWKLSQYSNSGFDTLLIRLDLPVSLAELPWELMHYKGPSESSLGGVTYLARTPQMALVRYFAEDDEAPPRVLSAVDELRMLSIVAEPQRWGFQEFSRDEYYQSLELLNRKRKIATIEHIAGSATLVQLREKLQQPLHVIDIVCHGVKRNHSDFGDLLFENDYGEVDEIGADDFWMHLHANRDSTRLVFISACVSANQSDENPFSSVGGSLALFQGVAVVAMQFLADQKTVQQLIRYFYDFLGDTGDVSQAMTIARLWTRATHDPFGWAVPVLYLQAKSAKIIEIDPEVNGEQKRENEFLLNATPPSNEVDTRPEEHIVYEKDRARFELSLEKYGRRHQEKYRRLMERAKRLEAQRSDLKRSNLIDTWLLQELRKESISCYIGALELQPGYEPHLYLGDIYFDETRWYQAKHHFEEALDYWSDSVSIMRKLEKVLRNIVGDKDETDEARDHARTRQREVRQRRQELEAQI
ncbi:MAG: CHAT domain-containing protein [Oscillochloris sp.]|nr:CHAT domain-containing protein [Oscillochloris sp.]